MIHAPIQLHPTTILDFHNFGFILILLVNIFWMILTPPLLSKRCYEQDRSIQSKFIKQELKLNSHSFDFEFRLLRIVAFVSLNY